MRESHKMLVNMERKGGISEKNTKGTPNGVPLLLPIPLPRRTGQTGRGCRAAAQITVPPGTPGLPGQQPQPQLLSQLFQLLPQPLPQPP